VDVRLLRKPHGVGGSSPSRLKRRTKKHKDTDNFLVTVTG
jgi:hypothetical protein